ncbi:hypothetical protein ACOZ4L_15800 (plasmid) [Haloplanus ruber]|uniref:MarR family transcriptional regulator n=1 Tax=Haloplanus ruber TaxID=869892 RepID=A0ABD6D1Q8_9EURY|nr:hypothetical protein [Haloplanus ruber]
MTENSPLNYDKYELNQEASICSFKEELKSPSLSLLAPRKDFDGESIEVAEEGEFRWIDRSVIDQLMYMDTQQTAKFVETIDDTALLRSMLVELKKAHQQTELERFEERLQHAESEEEKEDIRENHLPLGDESLLPANTEAAPTELTKHEASIIDYDYEAINEDSTADEIVAEFVDYEFRSIPEIIWEAEQQEGFSRGIPEKLLYKLAEKHLALDSGTVDKTVNELESKNLVNRTFPYHIRGSAPSVVRKWR